MRPPRVAILHDWLTTWGGAERCLLLFHSLFPTAPIYTLVCDRKNLPRELSKARIITSSIQRLPNAATQYSNYLPLMPKAVEEWDLSGFDLILSSCHCCVKGALTRTDQTHVSYCYTPIRYVWDLYATYAKHTAMSGFKRRVFEWSAHYIRMWDYLAAQRVDHFIAISDTVRRRIKRIYGRDSAVIYPPVDASFFTPDPAGARDYYLVVSRFVPYKRIDLAVEAFAGRTEPLLIVGGGPQEKKLKKMATPNIEFLGQVEDDELRTLYQNCRALVFPGEEDFGLTPIEAQACGKPVIALAKGGATETVVEGVTGTFFHEDTPDSLSEAVDKLQKLEIAPEACRENAEKFDQGRFLEEIVRFLKPFMERPGLPPAPTTVEAPPEIPDSSQP